MTAPRAPDTPGSPGTSTRPYLVRALHDWCTDNGFTPYIAVHVDATVQVPMEYVKNNEIVLNVGFEATANLELGNDFIRFRARFGGSAREIAVPVDHVVAIYARENGQGMAFPMPVESAGAPSEPAPAPRGLRLASVDGDSDGDSDGDGTADGPAAAPSKPHAPDVPDDPARGPGPGGKRPSLKRVK